MSLLHMEGGVGQKRKLCIEIAVLILSSHNISICAYTAPIAHYIHISRNLLAFISSVHMHQPGHQPQHGWSDKTPHPVSFQLHLVGRGAL